MLHDSAIEMNAPWPRPDASGDYLLAPSAAALAKYFLLFVLIAGLGAVLAVPPSGPQLVRIKGLIFVALGLLLITSFLYRALAGGFDLRLDGVGFALGKKRYAWADVSLFTLGNGRARRILYFNHAGARRTLLNLYGMPGQALVEFLNQQRALAGGGTGRPDLSPAGRLQRKTLSPRAWGLILALFIVTLTNLQPITTLLWQIFAPASYAAHTLDDQDLANKAGHNARFLPVLLARAQGGDKSAMYFMGDLYDPTDFLCESTVPKNAAQAVRWYGQAVPLDDEGAERSLGILYHLGVGEPHDDTTAAALLELSVTRHNDDIGDYYLGTMLETGQGESEDLARAVRLEQASAAQDNAQGETELGRMYMLGIGVPKDAATAMGYWNQAAAQGDTTAQKLITQYETHSPSQICAGCSF